MKKKPQEIKVLAAAFMYNIFQIYQSNPFDEKLANITYDIEISYNVIYYELMDKILEAIENIKTSNDTEADYHFIHEKIKQINNYNKPVQKIPYLKILLDELLKFNEEEQKMLESDKKVLHKKIVEMKKKKNLTTGLSMRTFQNAYKYTSSINYKDYHISGLIDQYMFKDIEDIEKKQARVQISLIYRLIKDDDLSIIFKVMPSRSDMDVAEYLFSDKEQIIQSIDEIMDKALNAVETKSSDDDFVKDMKKSDMRNLIRKIFDILMRYDLKHQSEYCLGNAEQIVNLDSIEYLKNRSNRLDIDSYIASFYQTSIPPVAEIEVSGVNLIEITDCTESAINLGVLDIGYLLDLIGEDKQVDIKALIEMPNIRSVLTYRYCQAIKWMLLDNEEGRYGNGPPNDYLENYIEMQMKTAFNSYGVFLDLNSKISAPAYIGKNVCIQEHVRAEERCVFGDNVSFHKSEEQKEGEYTIIGKNSVFAYGLNIKGVFTFPDNFIAEQNDELYLLSGEYALNEEKNKLAIFNIVSSFLAEVGSL